MKSCCLTVSSNEWWREDAAGDAAGTRSDVEWKRASEPGCVFVEQVKVSPASGESQGPRATKSPSHRTRTASRVSHAGPPQKPPGTFWRDQGEQRNVFQEDGCKIWVKKKSFYYLPPPQFSRVPCSVCPDFDWATFSLLQRFTAQAASRTHKLQPSHHSQLHQDSLHHRQP